MCARMLGAQLSITTWVFQHHVAGRPQPLSEPGPWCQMTCVFCAICGRVRIATLCHWQMLATFAGRGNQPRDSPRGPSDPRSPKQVCNCDCRRGGDVRHGSQTCCVCLLGFHDGCTIEVTPGLFDEVAFTSLPQQLKDGPRCFLCRTAIGS